MPLSWNEIKYRALAFSREWAEESRETAESQTLLAAGSWVTTQAMRGFGCTYIPAG